MANHTKNLIVGTALVLATAVLTGMAADTTEVGQYMGWGDATGSRYMLDTTNGQLYLWTREGWKRQVSEIEQ